MSNVRESFIDRMIMLYGFENPIVIDFCKMCEQWEENSWNDTILSLCVEAHEASPIFDED